MHVLHLLHVVLVGVVHVVGGGGMVVVVWGMRRMHVEVVVTVLILMVVVLVGHLRGLQLIWRLELPLALGIVVVVVVCDGFGVRVYATHADHSFEQRGGRGGSTSQFGVICNLSSITSWLRRALCLCVTQISRHRQAFEPRGRLLLRRSQKQVAR